MYGVKVRNWGRGLHRTCDCSVVTYKFTVLNGHAGEIGELESSIWIFIVSELLNRAANYRVQAEPDRDQFYTKVFTLKPEPNALQEGLHSCSMKPST